jgi:tetratricopeptide (TPR) repeat protein
MTIINNTHRFIFVHIPKCGGTSITRMFSHLNRYNDLELGGTPYGEVLENIFSQRYGFGKHSRGPQIRSVVGDDLWQRYYKFATVRNPFSRAISTYSYMKENEHHYKDMQHVSDFNAFVASGLWDLPGESRMLQPQAEWLIDADGSMVVDDIFHLETLAEHLPAIARRIGLDGADAARIRLMHENRSSGALVQPEEVAPRTIEKILRRYERDFIAFGYSEEWSERLARGGARRESKATKQAPGLGQIVPQLERAARLAGAGGEAEARRIVAEALAAAPDDLTVLHKAGVVLRACGEPHEALKLFLRALEIRPDFHFTEIEIGGALSDLGDYEDALRWYYKAAETAPNYVVPRIHAALLERHLGRGERAIAVLDGACAADPANREAQAQRARMLAGLGRKEEAVGAYERLIAAGQAEGQDQADYLALLNETGAYPKLIAHAATLGPVPGEAGRRAAGLIAHARLAQHCDREALIAEAARRESGPRWLAAEGVARALRKAIGERRPFALIRVGAREARLLLHGLPRLGAMLSPQDTLAAAEPVWRAGFAEELAQADPARVTATQAALARAMADADVIGMPTAERLRHDFANLGFLACLLDMIGDAAEAQPALRMADAAVNRALHLAAPFYGALLEGLDWLGLLSAYADLAERLGRRLGIGRVAGHVVAGPLSPPGELPAELSLPRRGAVVLVAAGIAGKGFCAEIKRRGGIAIDVGALADAWMGKSAPPGPFVPPEDWRLP